jgi:2,3-bisphosphoglycerate-independent phosphoglycerate mutase
MCYTCALKSGSLLLRKEEKPSGDRIMSFRGIDGNLTFVVMDGVGEREAGIGNAVKNAKMPFLNHIKKKYLFRTLQAHGQAVGMPSDADMGNSEVGHNAMGAGQIFDQGAKLVGKAIESGFMFQQDGWKEITSNVLSNRSTLHFIGLLSDGNVHSHIQHLILMIEQAVQQGIRTIRVHPLLDGRDVGETSALKYIDTLESCLAEQNAAGADARIASGGGRMKLTMDRYEADWSMVELGWNTHVHGKNRMFKSAREAIETYRRETGLTDQFLPGFVIEEDGHPVGPITDGDSVVFFNFRGDRAIEISMAFEDGSGFTYFDRGRIPGVTYAGMMGYDGDRHIPARYLVSPPAIKNTLGEYLANQGISQYAISETQKYGHVTYFWNGNRSGKFSEDLETYVEIPSDTLPFETRPWMQCGQITDTLITAIYKGDHRFLRVNYPNGDMVGHTGDYQATEVAMTSLDLQLKRLLHAVEETGGAAIITADHGNADEMFSLDKKGQPILSVNGEIKPKTSHTLAPVPFILFDPHQLIPATLNPAPRMGLSNLAGTITEILGLTPLEMWNPSVLSWGK